MNWWENIYILCKLFCRFFQHLHCIATVVRGQEYIIHEHKCTLVEMYTVNFILYSGIFSRIGGKIQFRGENFCELLAHTATRPCELSTV